ncbi:MAG: DUF4251 domain-containing protein [Eudoraea sp.]|nr:DUF4251 domain-containing protein [Eudoraea sp.]NNJ39349.1 DUF4251 domain-containing protein [Eudoraea sp.]
MRKHLKFIALYALWIGGIIYILGGCQATRTIASPEAVQALEQQVDSRNLRIKLDWAMPLTTRGMASVANAGLLPPGNNIARINLINTPNSFEMRGDSVFIDLPYFGERQVVSDYPGGKGINFTGAMENFRSSRDRKDQSYRLTFDTSDRSERFDVSLKIFPGQRAILVFYSNQRNTIRYEGTLENPQTE